MSVDEVLDDGIESDDDTCFSLRINGVWQQPLAATSVERSMGTKTTTLALSGTVETDAVAIWLTTYTRVSAIRYSIE
jgi:hypothetical protein